MLKSKGLASVTMKTFRERFIKIELPVSCPYADVIENCFLDIG
jgi:hypothetical protein